MHQHDSNLQLKQYAGTSYKRSSSVEVKIHMLQVKGRYDYEVTLRLTS